MHGIIPPFLLQRLTEHADETVAASSRKTLLTDAVLRQERIGRPPRSAATRDVRGARATTGPRRTIADAKNTTTLPGTTVRNEGDPPTGDLAADQAYDGLGLTWTMLFEAFGRDSLDGAGMPLLATVHYGERYDNAFWNGERMVFGDGDGEVFGSFTGAVDVIGHELAHGLIQSTVNLEYQDQPGALNESIADVIGTLTKQHALGQTAEQADWLIGVGLFTDKVQGEALRSMKAPGTAYDDDVLGKDPQVARMDDYVETSEDNGGVHINSGIPNYAFYLAATAIGGNAWESAGQIWIDVLTNNAVDTTADFAQFAAATIAAAAARFGEDSAERRAVADAWQQVGVAPSTTPAPTPPSDDPASETVTVQRSGGLLGRTQTGTLPESALPSAEQRQLNSLIDSGELQQLQQERAMPDAYVWRVQVETRIDVTLNEPALPGDVLQLFQRILDLGDNRPR
ncbi:hypothetical protein EK0264_07810 [Epidermidibacterium keratini]|uniref:Neutral metalloproteinase n=1 Tax=Epidermidibacterium keratini TaxID=1891644 RepID=A0A7L4YM29_9ACTN|nr:protealysin inhibitor emfourin [Epidermidibacterium keratini]QHC00190.1 hypothetical protein EK0264_07810 [Epidermidibacterium keratini]